MSTTHLDQMEQHEQAVAQAQALERQREQELLARTRELTRLHDERLQHERDVGGGGVRDPDAEGRFAELQDPDVHEVRQTHGTVWIDRRAEARLAGAREAKERAVQARGAFCSGAMPSLEEELAQGLDGDRKAVLAAARALDEALKPIRDREGRASRIWQLAGRGRQLEFVGGFQHFDELRRVIARVERVVPAPAESEGAAA